MERDEDETGVSASEYGDLFRRIRNWYRSDISRVQAWRKEAKEAFQFYAGDQWSKEDKTEMARKNRSPVVFNRIAPLVNAVVGSEINNRREVQYIPREQGDAAANEILTAAGEWFRDQTAAEDEESDAFQDNVIAGMGWTDTRLDFEDDPDGAPKIERIDPMEMVWDFNASKANLIDSQRMFRVKEFSWAEAQELFPDVPKEMLNASWVKTAGDSTPHDQDAADDYMGGQEEFVDAEHEKTCTIVECRWLEKEPYYRGPDLEKPGAIKEYAEKQFKLLQQQYGEFPGVRQTRKVVKRAFIGKDVLAAPDKPLVPPGMFGWECITGYYDKAEGQFYGIVRAAKDPQRWTNKFFSQVMYLLNSQSKGGIAAERGAFDDDRQAEQSWAKSDEITWMKNGSLSGPSPKIMPKAPAQFPAGFFTLFQESKEEVSQVTGLSPEFIGTREVDQAGVLEMQRRQSSLNLLASLFNALRRYRKRQGQIMLYLIQNHLNDGRLIRIVGDDKKQYVPLSKDAVASSTYDIIVDDAPTSPNEKDKTWQMLMQLMPLVKDMLTPDIGLELLRYSPLPASMVDKLMQKAKEAQQAQQQQPSPEEMALQAKHAELQMDLQGKQAEMQLKQQEGQMDLEMKGIELFIKQQEGQQKLQMDQAKLELDQQRIATQAAANAVSRQNANSTQTRSAKN